MLSAASSHYQELTPLQQYRGFRWWNKGGGSRTSNNHFTRDVLRADGTKAYVGYGVDSLTVGLVAICRVKFAGETRDAVASLYPTAEEARITCAIVDAAAKVRDLNFKYLVEGKGQPSPRASARMASPSAIPTAWGKARRGVSSDLREADLNCSSAAISQNQQPLSSVRR